MLIRSPVTASEFDGYYRLRWELLRAPWNQPLGSEKDEYEREAFHLAAWNDSGALIGVGRLHRVNESCAQIRFMAVDPSQRGKGIGKAILRELENHAVCKSFAEIVLNAREEAVRFYQAEGYTLLRPAHRLFGEIPHFEMRKQISQISLDREITKSSE